MGARAGDMAIMADRLREAGNDDALDFWHACSQIGIDGGG